ncbi:glycosyltransferase [Riemerella anatipestifer]
MYNIELCLRRCVDSALEQSYTNIEVILVNDGSKFVYVYLLL